MRKHSKVVIMGMVAAIMITGCSKPSEPTIQASKEEEVMTTSMPTYEPVQEESLKVERLPVVKKEEIRGMRVTKGGHVSYELNYHPTVGKDSYLYWEMSVPYKTSATVDTEAMYHLYSSITAIDFSKPSEVKKGIDTGIPKSKTSIKVFYTGNAKEERPRNKLTLVVGNKTKDGKYYCALEGAEDKIFELDQLNLNAVLNQNPFQLILKVPYLINYATVGEIAIKYGESTHQMKFSQGTYQLDDRKVEQKEYCDLYSQLMGLTIVKEISEGTKKTGTPLLTMDFKRNVAGAEDMEVAISAYDASNCSVQVNGEAYFLVATSEVEQLLHVIKAKF